VPVPRNIRERAKRRQRACGHAEPMSIALNNVKTSTVVNVTEYLQFKVWKCKKLQAGVPVKANALPEHATTCEIAGRQEQPVGQLGGGIWPPQRTSVVVIGTTTYNYGLPQVGGRICNLKGSRVWLHVWRSSRLERLHLDTAQRHKASMAQMSACAWILANVGLLGRRLQM
jgi:hypothetical protein